MLPPNSKELLTCFSPSLDLYATSHGDGRVKIWDTAKGHLQAEFVDIASSTGSDALQPGPVNGHLSVDYTCMAWAQLQKKKKKKPGSYVLVLGTGSGDVVAFDVSGGELKWKVNDCHPGGVSALSVSEKSSCIYTAGVDGMVCQIDCSHGNILGKFRASTKAISSLSISPDGKMFATASGQIKVFNSSDHKKVQKFSGHPVSISCMTFSEDGKHILSSAVEEKFITMWKIDHTKNRSACCVLPVEYPIICLDYRGFNNEDGSGIGLCILAVSVAGLCYFWYGRNLQNLHDNKPTRISLSAPASGWKNNDHAPAINSARLLGITKPESGVVLVAHGSTIKPHFEKVDVQYGVDVDISWFRQSSLLPMTHLYQSQKQHTIGKKVTTLDRANAEDAVIPFPKILNYQDKKRKHKEHHSVADSDEEMVDTVPNEPKLLDIREVQQEDMEEEDNICLEDMLKSKGILCRKDETKILGFKTSTAIVDAAVLKDVSLFIGANKPTKKISDSILSMFREDAFKLEVLIFMWKTRLIDELSVLPWISYVIIHYVRSILSQESQKMVDELCKMTMIKSSAFEPLLNLSGRLQLVTAQVDKSHCYIKHPIPFENPVDGSDGDDDGDDDDVHDIDEVVYGQEDSSLSSDDHDDE